MMLEVERKFRITNAVASSMPEKLISLGFMPVGETVMKDIFLPTDNPSDMLRIREEQTVKPDGALVERIVFTAKRWKVFPDGSKEREEQEEEIAPLVRDSFIRLGEKIAGGALLTFTKKRALFEGQLGDFASVVSVDFAQGLGDNSGYYMEIEVLVETECNLADVRQQIQEQATRLLGANAEMVNMSYMDMLRLAGSV
jgi:adenylate cyclase class IV